ncbi:ABC-type glycerol-3-phosphate transport system permease component [Bradyrhizobium sp. GM6.1]
MSSSTPSSRFRWRCRRPTRSRATVSSATSICSSGCCRTAWRRAAVYALPFFNLYSAIGLFDTPWAVALAHCIFNVPLAVWILEGFVSGVPREIDETAFLDGYSFPRFFIKILVPLIASGIGVAAFFCFMFSWVELLLARTLTSVQAKPIAAIMTRTVSAAGMDWGLLAAAGVLTIIPGALVIWFVRNYIASGFALGRV